MPKKISITEKIIIQDSPEVIFDYISDLKKWKDWSVWNEEYYQKSGNYYKTYFYSSNFFQSNREDYLPSNISSSFPSSLIVESNITVDAVLLTEITKRIQNESVSLVIKAFGEVEEKNHAFANITLNKQSKEGSVFTTVQWSFTNDYYTYRKNLLDRYWIWFYTIGLKKSYQNSLSSLKNLIEESPSEN